MSRWSKLQKQIYNLIDPKINLQIHCIRYPMRSQYGSTDCPRYWITLDKDIIWDYPKDFPELLKGPTITSPIGISYSLDYYPYPYITEISNMSNLIREYINTPKCELLTKEFENDTWGLLDIILAADRRISIYKLSWSQRTFTSAAELVIKKRIGGRVITKRIDDKEQSKGEKNE